MFWRIFGAKPLSQPILAYCQLDPWKQILKKLKNIFNRISLSKIYEFQSIFHWHLFPVSNCWQVSIGSDNGLPQNRRHVKIWIRDNVVSWPIYASFGIDELTHRDLRHPENITGPATYLLTPNRNWTISRPNATIVLWYYKRYHIKTNHIM